MAEILAPAGNFDMLKAAVCNGADAVYLGLNKFSARAKAENFNNEQLKNAIEYAHLYGVKIYVAINTIMKNDELSEALNEAERALSLGADALIVQDLGFAQLLRRKFPTAVLHASTQMGIHNLEGAIVAKKLGFSRIILARETLFEDIIKIKQNVDIEVECFVQGALCIAFSGNCYFSSFVSGYSGNRGKCMQLCRKKYSIKNGSKNISGYLLSSKDLMLAMRIKKLLDAKVDCFKIEGRLRRSEYVAEAVRVYKKALREAVDQEDIVSLKKTFNRGDYTEGHLFCATNKVLDVNIASHMGVYFCKVTKVIGRKAVLNRNLNSGDGIKFLRNGKEVGAAAITRNGNETGFEGNVRPGDDVYITTDSEFNARVNERSKKISVDVTLDFDRAALFVSTEESEVEIKIGNVQPAINVPLTVNELKNNFNKSEYFVTRKVNIKGNVSAFIVKSELNALRRNAYELLKKKILSDYLKKRAKYNGNFLTISDIMSDNLDNLLNNKKIYQVESPEQITDDMEIVVVNPQEYSVERMLEFKSYFKNAFLNLPFIARGKDVDVLRDIIKNCNFKGYIVNNLYGLELVKDRRVILGIGLNLINDVIDVDKIYSIESDIFLKNGYVYAQGNVPLMTFCHCERKELLSDCKNCDGVNVALSYEGREFYLRRYKIHYCYGQLLNCATLDVLNKGVEKAFIDYSYKRANGTTKGNYGRGLR